jgi:threonine dehydrogenase-like Zn-dependent dehydrogenase
VKDAVLTPPGGDDNVARLKDLTDGIGADVVPQCVGTPESMHLAREIEPVAVYDLTLPLEETAEGYAAMDERRAIKILFRP